MGDIICTASSMLCSYYRRFAGEQPIIFSRNLGRYVMAETGRDLLCGKAAVLHEA